LDICSKQILQVPDFQDGNPICEAMYHEFEDKVNRYGYSLRHPRRVTIPKIWEQHVIVPRPGDLENDPPL
jgi:hypothetical protein